MKIVTIIPLVRGAFKEDLTYFTSKDVENGNIVNITVRNRKILGLVVSSEDITQTKSGIKNLDFNLKKILDVKGQSIFSKEYLESSLLIGKYFVSKNNDAIVSLIPSSFREAYDKITNRITKLDISKKIKDKKIQAEKLLFQAPIIDRLSYYKTLIRGNFADKKSVFIILPTEQDIKKFSEILTKGVEPFTFLIHGNLNPKKQIEKFEQITNSSHPVLVLGTAPYLCIPRNDFGVIILEHESSNAYKMIANPHFDLRTFAELYASKSNIKFVLADSLLRFETIARKELDNLVPISPLSFRVNFSGSIEISNRNEKFEILNNTSISEIQNVIAKKESVFIFSLRKGLATVTTCRDCNQSIICEKCSAPVVLYFSGDGKKRMFVCNKCGTEKNSETVCPSCGSWNLIPLGIGTDTIFEEAQKRFPETKIYKLDKESAKTAKGADKIIKDFEDNPGSILIGTEMALYYLTQTIPLSVIASFDSLWSIPNYKMSEKIIQLLVLIISKTDKKLIIETKNQNDKAILAVLNENLLSFIREELKDREKFKYPPFKRFIKITYLGDKTDTISTKKMLGEFLKDYNPEIFSGFIFKQKNKYVTNTLIKLEPKNWSLPELSTGSSIDQNLFQKLISLPPTFTINIDPEDLL